MQWAFGLSVILLAVLPFIVLRLKPKWAAAMPHGGTNLKRTSLVFAACWAVQTSYVYATGVYDPWVLFTVTNLIAAWIILPDPSNKIQSMIGAILTAQAVIDVGYGLAGNEDAMIGYLVTQTNLGWLIILLLGVWNGRIFVRNLCSMGGGVSSKNGSESVGQ